MTIDEIKREIALCKFSLDFCIQARSVPYADIKTWDESIAEWQYQINKWEQKLREVENV